MTKTTTIPCADVKMHTFDTIMHAGETRTGSLHMHDEFMLEFHEGMSPRYTRNPMVYQGKYINVHRDKQGHYQVHLLRMELKRRTNPERVSKAICRELETAKKQLGL